MPDGELTGEAADEALTRSLTAQGFTVRPRPEGGLIVANVPSYSLRSDGPERPYLLWQEVVCAPDSLGAPWWFWVWAGEERSGPQDVEPMCPAADLDQAVKKIGKVLSPPSAGRRGRGVREALVAPEPVSVRLLVRRRVWAFRVGPVASGRA